MVLHKNIKREFAYQTFIETIAGNHIECELKAVMDLCTDPKKLDN